MSEERITPLWSGCEPNFERLRCVFNCEEPPDRVPFIELGVDLEVMDTVLGEKKLDLTELTKEVKEELLRRRIRFCQYLCYDYVWAHPEVPWEMGRLTTTDTADLSRGERGWVNENEGVIASMEDFERYPWPTPESVDYSGVEFVVEHLPEGMKLITCPPGGILEWVMWLMGFVPFATGIYDQPDLIEAMFEKIGELYVPIYETLADFPKVGAMLVADDMGYKTGPFIAPEHLRKYVFPRQKKLAEISHAHGYPFWIHACGNLEAVMDDLIDDVGIDGKHSFEDTFLSAGEAKRRYGDRIAILGGVDMDMLSRSSEEEVRAYTRRLLEECMPGGGYALGTGNTVANYIPVKNYLAMLDEGMNFGRYN